MLLIELLVVPETRLYEHATKMGVVHIYLIFYKNNLEILVIQTWMIIGVSLYGWS